MEHTKKSVMLYGIEGFDCITDVVKEKHERKNFGEDWHFDSMYLEPPPRATLLYALETPQIGGDTFFASSVAAYDELSTGMKQMLAGLVGVASASLKNRPDGAREQYLSSFRGMRTQNSDQSNVLEAKHPVVRSLQETGNRALFVSALHTIRFDGFTERESRPLIEFLNNHCLKPEYTCRVSWEPGQLTVWDNRTTLHCAVNDYHGNRRHMRRLTVGPEAPMPSSDYLN